MKTPLHFDAGIIGAGLEIEPTSAPLLAALRARGVRLIAATLDPPSPGQGGAPPADPLHHLAGSPGVDPGRFFVVTRQIDAIRRARQGGYGFIAGVESTAGTKRTRTTAVTKRALREAGADLAVSSLADLALGEIDAWFANRDHARPAIPSHNDAIARRLEGRTAALFLDYDGTLTPIVERPELALLAPEMRRVLSDLAAKFPTVIVSGRAREDVARLVGNEALIYAGSHGFDIAGPGGRGRDTGPADRVSDAAPGAAPPGGRPPIKHEVAAELQPVLRQAATALETALTDIPGVLVEDKRFSVAVHYRQAAADRVAEIEAAVDRVIAELLPDRSSLKKILGKKVMELRPSVEWDKGQAVLWLLRTLDLDREEVVPIYVGDDTTDEDAFRALLDRGVTALVSRTPRPTAAGYALQDCEEVGDFLRLINSLGRSGMKLA